jgi:hypothetical protein
MFSPSGEVPAHSCVSAPKCVGCTILLCIESLAARKEGTTEYTYNNEGLRATEMALELALQVTRVERDRDDAVCGVAARKFVADENDPELALVVERVRARLLAGGAIAERGGVDLAEIRGRRGCVYNASLTVRRRCCASAEKWQELTGEEERP